MQLHSYRPQNILGLKHTCRVSGVPIRPVGYVCKLIKHLKNINSQNLDDNADYQQQAKTMVHEALTGTNS